MTPSTDEKPVEWIGVVRAAKILGCTPYLVPSAAIAYQIRTRTRLRLRLDYHLGDVERVAAAHALQDVVSCAVA
jgi:hypothetical protein